LNKDKRRIIRPSEKFRNIFNFDWDASEDTSIGVTPIIKSSSTSEPHLLFGRGMRGGFDIKEQKRKTK
jgi:ATP-dependent RNA helicase DDX23/PRP28